MKNNFETDEEVRMSADFFNRLSDEDKILVVTDLHPSTFKIPQYYESLVQLLSYVQDNMTRYDSITMGNMLMDMGIEETWARLLVTNMKKHAPTLSYQISQMNRIDDSKFADMFEKMMDQMWREKTPASDVADQYGISLEQLECMSDVMSQCIYDIMRGDNSATNIYAMLSENGLPPAKVDAIIKSINLQEKDWYRWFLFRNTQDSLGHVQEIQEQNAQILNILNEILAVLKDQRPDRHTRRTPGVVSPRER